MIPLGKRARKPANINSASFYNPGLPVNPFNPPIGVQIANPLPAGGAGGQGPKIVRIEKMYNCVIYEKFINEFKRMLRKYPHK